MKSSSVTVTRQVPKYLENNVEGNFTNMQSTARHIPECRSGTAGIIFWGPTPEKAPSIQLEEHK